MGIVAAVIGTVVLALLAYRALPAEPGWRRLAPYPEPPGPLPRGTGAGGAHAHVGHPVWRGARVAGGRLPVPRPPGPVVAARVAARRAQLHRRHRMGGPARLHGAGADHPAQPLRQRSSPSRPRHLERVGRVVRARLRAVPLRLRLDPCGPAPTDRHVHRSRALPGAGPAGPSSRSCCPPYGPPSWPAWRSC